MRGIYALIDILLSWVRGELRSYNGTVGGFVFLAFNVYNERPVLKSHRIKLKVGWLKIQCEE